MQPQQVRESGMTGFTRRAMMATGGAALASPALPGVAWGQRRKLAASDKVNIAVIGAGGQGASNMTKLVGENIVAACDVDFDRVNRQMLDKHFRPIPERIPLQAAYDKATRYSDY